MRFGVYFDLRNPAAWARPWPAVYADALDLAAEAERLGAGAVWLSEHHLFDDGYLSQPLTMAAAIAARTSTVRIGTAVLVASLRHPRHVAEEAAIVDLISNGRLELALGAGYSALEFDAFGIDGARRYELTDSAVAEVLRLWHAGDVSPPPVQTPPPLWLGYQGPRGAMRAGRLGVGLLSLDHSLLAPYNEGLRAGRHDPDAARMGGLVEILVSDDPDMAREQALPHYAHQVNSYRRAAVAGTGRPEPKVITVDRLREGMHSRGKVPGLAVLTPEEAIEHVRSAVADLPATDVYAWASVAGMPDDLVQRHLELWLGPVRAGVGAVATSK
jgi:alkanesulfonate monooxygenase SsuD/methylene tetrahydromethanopterin reductase-like flavin-dependent oxidoreductase (luciferase family)